VALSYTASVNVCVVSVFVATWYAFWIDTATDCGAMVVCCGSVRFPATSIVAALMGAITDATYDVTLASPTGANATATVEALEFAATTAVGRAVGGAIL